MESPLLGSFGPSTYGDSFADVYDAWYHDISDPQATAAFVSHRSGPGPIAELGVGTGRLVDALIGRGAHVIGFDASAAMIDGCAPRPGLTRVLGDLAALPLPKRPGGIGGALCAFNTLFNLDSVDKQAALFESVAGALHPEGSLVIEAITGVGLDASASSGASGDSVGISRIEADRLVLSATRIDADAQTIIGQHVDITDGNIRLRPWRLRWTTPSQLDGLADRTGLVLTERYADWDESPFEPDGERHVSVYRPA